MVNRLLNGLHSEKVSGPRKAKKIALRELKKYYSTQSKQNKQSSALGSSRKRKMDKRKSPAAKKAKVVKRLGSPVLGRFRETESAKKELAAVRAKRYEARKATVQRNVEKKKKKERGARLRSARALLILQKPRHLRSFSARLSFQRGLTRESLTRGRSISHVMENVLQSMERRLATRMAIARDSMARRLQGRNTQSVQREFTPMTPEPVFAVPLPPQIDDDKVKAVWSKMIEILGFRLVEQDHTKMNSAIAIGKEINTWLWEKPDEQDLLEWTSGANYKKILEALFYCVSVWKLEQLLNTDQFSSIMIMITSGKHFRFADGETDPCVLREAAKIIICSLIPDEWKMEVRQFRSILAFLFLHKDDFGVMEDPDSMKTVCFIREKANADPEGQIMQMAHQNRKYVKIGRSQDDGETERKVNMLFVQLKDAKTQEEMIGHFHQMAENVSAPAGDIMFGMLLLALARS